jgi:predicted nucleic acid-binding protein
LTEPLTALATALFDLLAADPAASFHVPDLFFIECANIFWKHARAGGCSPVEAAGAVANLCGLRLQSTPTHDLAADALAVAAAQDISAYDAAYVALGARLGLPMLTADQKLVNKLAGTSYRVSWLGAWVPPSTSP